MFFTRRIARVNQISLPQRSISTACPTKEWTFAMVKPDGISHIAPIFGRIHQEGFEIRKLKMTKFNKATAKNLYEDILHKEFYPTFSDYITSGPIIAMRLRRLDSVSHWRNVMGPTDSCEAKETSPNSIRAMYGTDLCSNAVHGAEDHDQVIKASNMFFSDQSLFGREEIKFPNALFVLPQTFMEEGKLEIFFEKMQESGLFLNTMRMYDSEELRTLSPKISENIAENLAKQGTIGGKILMVELSHPDGYRSLHEGVTRIQTFSGASQILMEKSKSKATSNLFL
mmetsp:Transcript_6221/g.5341  ORF Transcript_6221/g.5341 Transcript_6221/m.5341 type:complete len:284 (+) Transcript_6221:43-894(+)